MNPRKMALNKGEVVIVGSDRGGVGKTMTAEIVVTRMWAHGVRPIVVEVESEPRLSLVLGENTVRCLQISTHGPEELEREPGLLYEVWESLGDVLVEAKVPVVVDLGANLTKALAAYLAELGEDGPFQSGAKTWFLGVTGGDRFSLNSVNHGLSYIAQALPDSHRWLVINEQNARFQIASDSATVQEIEQAHRLDGTMRLKACTSPALQSVVDESLPLAEAVMQEAEYWVRKGYGMSEARRAVRRFRSFLADATSMLDPMFPRLTSRGEAP